MTQRGQYGINPFTDKEADSGSLSYLSKFIQTQI